ncbi:YggS family pyridoxal phosphate-dependent enzyme [Candidatus Acidulodesulfobacterium sp. H_13]|uniref:YggS family pyridoxal phosphate-dependent enzyme n=1 Tax=Candidatus Acidulodesulfobacterium sp. H_13 TaxID=3395470 RepID=UPI003AF6D653
MHKSSISEDINAVLMRAKSAAARSGRNFSDITVLAASKTRNTREIIEALGGGITVFGENYIQEFLPKYEALTGFMSKGLSWHIIGHVQKNKVKYIIGKTDLIHSIDSLKLATRLNDRSASENIVANILIEVNVADEKTKNGVKIDGVYDLVKDLNYLSNLNLRGFMTMPPFGKGSRKCFKMLREILEDVNAKGMYREKLSTLSMGTSSDFEDAIEEGATIIRLGTVIFGERPLKNI